MRTFLWASAFLLFPCKIALGVQSSTNFPPTTIGNVPPGVNVSAAATGSSVVLAWSSDSLHVVRVDSLGKVQVLLNAVLLGPRNFRQVTQLSIRDDSVHILLSNRSTRYSIGRSGEVQISERPLKIQEGLRKTYSAVGSIRTGAIDRAILVPLLLPASTYGRERDAILVEHRDRWEPIDSISLGRRIVQIPVANGSTVVYDSPLRALYDEGTRISLSSDGSTLALVDVMSGPDSQLVLSIRTHHWKDSSVAIPLTTKWSTPIPHVLIQDELWKTSVDSAVKAMTSLFSTETDARSVLSSLVNPRDRLPPISSIRTKANAVLVEYNEIYAKRTGLPNIQLLTSGTQCSIWSRHNEFAIALGSIRVWTAERRDSLLTIRAYPTC